jgi:hypothetical protein
VTRVMGGVYTDVEKMMIELQRSRSSRKPATRSRKRCAISSSATSST